MSPRLPVVLVAHHRESCGGLLPGLLEREGPLQWVHPLDGETLPPVGQVSGAVFMGSRHCVHDNIAGLSHEREWLEQMIASNKPVLGICFGAQLIGVVAGATVKRGSQTERGAAWVFPAPGQDIVKTPMQVMQWHEDGIYNLPANCQKIARGCQVYPEQVFQFGSAIGLQFHPETTPDMLSRWINKHPTEWGCPQKREALFVALSEMHEMRQWLSGLIDHLFEQDIRLTQGVS